MVEQGKTGELRAGEIVTLVIEFEPVSGMLKLGGTAASFTERLGMLEHALLLLRHEYARLLAMGTPRLFQPALKVPQRIT